MKDLEYVRGTVRRFNGLHKKRTYKHWSTGFLRDWSQKISAYSASISDSIGASSNSSNRDKRVAPGNYRVIDVAQAPP